MATAGSTNTGISEEPRSTSDSSQGWTTSELHPALDPAIVAYQASILGQVGGDRAGTTTNGNVAGQAETFVFSPISFNAMVVKPKNDTSDLRHRYHISIQMNHFVPTSFITTIRRGGSDAGQFVGDFEVGQSTKPPSICIRGKEWPLGALLDKSGSKTSALWTWQMQTVRGLPNFTWDCTKTPYTCRPVGKKQAIIATFSPAKRQRPLEPGVIALPLAQIEVFPEGREYFDDLLMAVLVIERKRLTPFKF